jgi:benzoyl-CoA reductase/2-hydroxyglutaryl-CoA dehydratase subunit BcrC/BadD/HgdB
LLEFEGKAVKQKLLTKLQQITEQNIADIEAHKKAGNHAIGFYCLYAPTELAVAADAIPFSLCGTRQAPIEAAEESLPRNLCPWSLSKFCLKPVFLQTSKRALIL